MEPGAEAAKKARKSKILELNPGADPRQKIKIFRARASAEAAKNKGDNQWKIIFLIKSMK